MVPARAENVAVLRRAISGIGESVGMEEAGLGDLQTIITEAAMNVVVHAYDGGDGPLEVTASRSGHSLEIVVRDHGSGFRPRPADPDRGELRLGLPLIAALSDGFQISGGPGRGTEVRVSKRIVGDEEAVEAPAEDLVAGDGTRLSFATDVPVAPVLSRVIGMLASRADLSIDRLADSQLLGDAVSTTGSSEFTDGRVDVEVFDREGCLEIRVGPLVPGAAERLVKGMELPRPLAGSLRALASGISVAEGDGGSERLLIEVEERR